MGTEILMESLNQNQNLNDDQRILIYKGICDIGEFVSNFYKVNINYNNIEGILKSVKLVDVDEADLYFSYSSENNQITRKKSSDEENMTFDFYKSMLSLISQRYDESMMKYQSGVIFENELGRTYNKALNNELLSRITTMITGIEDRNRKDSIDKEDLSCIKDVVIDDFSQITGFETLISCFFDARGMDLFGILSEKIGVEQAEDLISIVDDSEKDFDDNENKIKIAKRQKYDAYIKLLLDMNLETIPTL